MSYTSDDDSKALKAMERGAAGGSDGHPGSVALRDKAAINAGLTGDKIAGADLSAAPMGADAEAGGASADQGRAAPAVAAEGSAARDPNRANAVAPRFPGLWLLLAIAAALILGVVLYGALD